MIISFEDKLRKPLICTARFIRFLRNRLTLLKLKIKGCNIDWSATVHWSVVVERSRGKIVIGPRTSIDRGVILRAYGGSIIVGSDCSINAYSVVYGDGGLVIGNGVRVAAHTVIVPSNHIFSDPHEFIFNQGESRIGITIEDDVWLGAGVKVLDGVSIKKGTVVGAGSVVTKSTEPFDIFVGVPAKKISSRLSRFLHA